MKTLVISYSYPQPEVKPSPWNTLLAANPNIVRDVIINPDSGPGTGRDAEYLKAVCRCKKKGIGVMGYVATTYANKPMAEVEAEIQRYWDWYGVTNIFLDEVTSTPDRLGYYKSLYSFIAGKVVLNPGVVPDEGYYAAGDLLVIFESTQTRHAQAKFPAWLQKYRAKNCQIVLACPGLKLAATLKKISATSGTAFVTDDTESNNPYDRLPSYWPAFVSQCSLLP